MPTNKKRAEFTPEGISQLPNDKPVVYELLNGKGKNVYTGIAKRGRVKERISEHLPGKKDTVPGVKLVITIPVSSIKEAAEKEKRIIARTRPRHNKQGK